MTYKIDALTLTAGADINVREIGVKIHQPNIKEIAYIGEERFFQALNIFFIDVEGVKETLSQKVEDPEQIEVIDKLTEFLVAILMLHTDERINDRFGELAQLLFDCNKITIYADSILLEDEDFSFEINESNFYIIKDVVKKIFRFDKLIDDTGANAQSEKAKKIAEKLKKSRQKIKEQEKKDGSIFSYYISILSIGSNALNINDLCCLTVYQLYAQFERFGLYSQYEQSVKAALAGAKVEIVDWLKEI